MDTGCLPAKVAGPTSALKVCPVRGVPSVASVPMCQQEEWALVFDALCYAQVQTMCSVVMFIDVGVLQSPWSMMDLSLLSVCPVFGQPVASAIADLTMHWHWCKAARCKWTTLDVGLMSVIKCKYSLCFFVFSNFCKYIVLADEWFAPISCRWWAACNACRYSLDQLDLAFRMGTQKTWYGHGWKDHGTSESLQKSGCSETRQ